MDTSVFSKRHSRALRDKRLQVSVSRRVRGRIRKTMEKYDDRYMEADPYSNWQDWTSHLEQTERELCRIEGVDKLIALDYSTQKRAPTDVRGYVEGAYPPQVFDAIEVFLDELPPDSKTAFRRDVNQIFAEEDTEWRLLDRSVVKLDTTMLDAGVTDQTVDLLRAMQVEGALEEFRDALDEMTEGDSRDAIQDACNAFESVLKAVTGGNGNATQLLDRLMKGPHLRDLPEAERKTMKRVLQALPTLGNNLGRHGQGTAVLEVHARYAQLAVHLAGASIIFLLDAHSAIQSDPAPQTNVGEADPEAPF